MAEFKHVFKTTTNVWLSILLIGAIVVAVGFVAVLIIGGLGMAFGPSHTRNDGGYHEIEIKVTDEEPTSMPLSKWKKLVADGIKAKCPFEGMTKQELEAAIGQPSSVQPDSDEDEERWKYKKDGKCIRYSGDVCAERESEESSFQFTPNGHLLRYKNYDDGIGFQKNCYSSKTEDFYIGHDGYGLVP